MRRGEGPEPARGLLQLPGAADSFPRPAWYQATTAWTSPWKKSLPRLGGAPGVLERLVRREILTRARELEAPLEVLLTWFRR